MRNSFMKTLVDIAKKIKDIYLLTGDLGYGALNPFIESYPERFINAGIAEQNMMGIAAGMAKEGKTVIVYSIGNFTTLRCLEQIRNDCAYNNVNVKIVSVGGGFAYGALGMSHHATEDIAILRALPGIKVYTPADAIEAELCTKLMLKEKGTCYLRLNKGGEKILHTKAIENENEAAIKLKEGKDIAIFATGAILDEAKEASELLIKEGISASLYSFPVIKPIDKNTILNYANKCKLIVTIEEHNILGGFGGAVAEIMAENPSKARLLRIGLKDEYTSVVGEQKYLRDYYGISSAKIVSKIKEIWSVKL